MTKTKSVEEYEIDISDVEKVAASPNGWFCKPKIRWRGCDVSNEVNEAVHVGHRKSRYEGQPTKEEAQKHAIEKITPILEKWTVEGRKHR